jgi:ribonuclease J
MSKNNKIRLVSLGGIGEIGKNCNVIECGNSAVLIDCGLTFPDAHMLGVDLVIPDFTYLLRNRSKLKAVILTHGHEDHIGSLPYLLQDMVPPVIYGTPLTLGLVRSKLSEFTLPDNLPFKEIEAGDRIEIDRNLTVDTFHVAHSIPDGLALVINTPAGKIVHTGDFKLDREPIDHLPTDLEGIKRACAGGNVLALMIDTTNIERPGWTGSESEVGPALAEYFETHNGRIFITTFASNIHRVQQVIDLAEEYGRKVFLAGRTMLKNEDMARSLGYLRVPPNLIIPPDDLTRYPPRKIVVLATGSQGEPMAALSQISREEHRFVSVQESDLVIFSASPIPGNETFIFSVINDLFRLGAEVIYGLDAGVHVSGHAAREEIHQMYEAVRPRWVIPVHSQYRHQMLFRKVAEDWGHKSGDVVIMWMGDVLTMDAQGWELGEKVKSGAVLIDGLSIGGVSSSVVHERTMLAEDGVIDYVLVLDHTGDHILYGPEVKARGFPSERQNPQLYAEMKEALTEALFHNRMRSTAHQTQLRNNLANTLQRFVSRKLGISPTVMGSVIHLEPSAHQGGGGSRKKGKR